MVSKLGRTDEPILERGIANSDRSNPASKASPTVDSLSLSDATFTSPNRPQTARAPRTIEDVMQSPDVRGIQRTPGGDHAVVCTDNVLSLLQLPKGAQ